MKTQPAVSRTTRQKTTDVRTMLETLGVGDYVIPMAIQQAFFLPRVVDPYAAGVQELVKGLQRGLRRLGYPVVVDGGLGDGTAAALEAVSGPRWYDKNFVQLMGDVINGRPAKVLTTRRIAQTPQAGFVGDLITSPLGLLGIGAAVWYFFLREPTKRKATRKKVAGWIEGS